MFFSQGRNVSNVEYSILAVSVPDQLQPLSLAMTAPFKQHIKFIFDNVADQLEKGAKVDCIILRKT